MKIIEAINRIDSLVHNSFNQTEKISWLSSVDWMIKKHVIDNHEGAENVIFNGYHAETGPETQLLAEAPYDDLYLHWLEAQIHLYSGEYGKYNNAILMYNSVFEAFSAYYTRTHMPVCMCTRFLF